MIQLSELNCFKEKFKIKEVYHCRKIRMTEIAMEVNAIVAPTNSTDNGIGRQPWCLQQQCCT